MVRIDKVYFTLREIADRWGVRKRDLTYMIENGLLQTSLHVVGVHIERGLLEIDRGQEFHIPDERSWFTGLVDVMVRDTAIALRGGEARVVHFHTPEDNEYAMLIEPTAPTVVKAKQLVVRRCERDRVEAHYGETGATVAEGIGFQHSSDYGNVRLGTAEFALGVVQARVIRLLHQAALSDSPWCDGKTLLTEAGAASLRMSDVLKSQKQWRQLIQSDGRGRYRLRLKPE